MEEEVKKPSRKKKSDGEKAPEKSCAHTNVKSIWVVGGALIVLVTIFCIALFNQPKQATTGAQNLPAMPVNAQGVAMEGVPLPAIQYQMDPFLQQMAPQQVAFNNGYRPNCVVPGSGFRQVNMQPVAMAGTHSGPPIFRDAQMLHAFRGVCENCHIVSPDIPIPASAQQRHEYRGVCSNCHAILGLNNNGGA